VDLIGEFSCHCAAGFKGEFSLLKCFALQVCPILCKQYLCDCFSKIIYKNMYIFVCLLNLQEF